MMNRLGLYLRKKNLLVIALLIAGLMCSSILAQTQPDSDEARAESLRLASAATEVLDHRLGSPELAALLSIRALKTAYTSEAEATLIRAVDKLYTQGIFISNSSRWHTRTINDIAFSPDGRMILTGSGENELEKYGPDMFAKLWDVETGKEIYEFPLEKSWPIDAVAFSPDGSTILTLNGKSVWLWDTQTKEKIRQFVNSTDISEGFISEAMFSPDGRALFTDVARGTSQLWDVQTGAELMSFGAGMSTGNANIAFSPDGRFILIPTDNNSASLWDVQTGEEIRQFTGHTKVVTNVAFNPDGLTVLTSSVDTTARLWDVQTGAEIRRFAEGTDWLTSVAFSPDGHTVATAGWDNSARLWDVQTGEELRRFVAHTEAITRVVFSPDGRSILTASRDGTARLWDAQIDSAPTPFVPTQDINDLIAYACSRIFSDFVITLGDAHQRSDYGITDTEPTCPQFAEGG